MAPPTLSPSCDGCHRLSLEVSELKIRVSRLHQIRDTETFLDSICDDLSATENGHPDAGVSCAAMPIASNGGNLDDTVRGSPPLHHVPTRSREFDDTIGPGDRWSAPRRNATIGIIQNGAPTCSTPVTWTKVARGKHGGPSPPLPLLHPPPPITSNTFSILDTGDFPPLPGPDDPPINPGLSNGSLVPPSSLVRSKSSASGQNNDRKQLLKQAVRRKSVGPIKHIPPAPKSVPPKLVSPPPSTTQQSQLPTNAGLEMPSTSRLSRPRVSPTVLIIGDSIMKHIHFTNSKSITHCLPGATILDLLRKLPDIFASLPTSISKVLVHIGTNDTAALCRSELVKLDYLRLVDFLVSSGKSFFLSGPIPTYGRGDERFSRIASLNCWMRRLCQAHNLNFIDNFNLFWNRPSCFNRDGLHPNKLGCQLLSANLEVNLRQLATVATLANVASNVVSDQD